MMALTGLYRDEGLEIYENSHYPHGEHITEVEQILSWYRAGKSRVLDIGCSGGLHAIEFSRNGFSVTGLDMESSAIERAKKRAGNMPGKAEFEVFDVEIDDFSHLGKFDLVYSIGNVLSHIRKNNILNVLKKIQGCMDENGIFLFDVLINEKPFRRRMLPGKKDIQIIWERKIDAKTGGISMDGTFLEYGFAQHFDVWGYSIEEILAMLKSSGFRNIEFSGKLDFAAKDKTKNPISLYI
ncbi:MAG: methyltransferase domain-containing protein [Candidatus Methanoperedens sp.]|nr:methyltransferase domain-containing protein [Candidatus Methanoperedens sp.]MCZ7369271.1 methyltransferase domain-containing protein [Candidatus Methanoperedens sp.]